MSCPKYLQKKDLKGALILLIGISFERMFWLFYIWFYHWYGNIDVTNIMLLYSNLGRKSLGQPFHDIPNFNAPKSSFQNKQRLHYLRICFQG